jgi:hypothetical protein
MRKITISKFVKGFALGYAVAISGVALGVWWAIR